MLAEITTPEALDKAAAAGIDLAAIEAAFVAVAVEAPHRDLQKAVGAYLAALDPDGPEPDPTEGRSLSIVQHSDGTYTGGFSARSGRRGEGGHRAGVDRGEEPLARRR